MSIKLRGHHLLCLLTYVGKGYSAAFVQGFDSVCERINAGEHIVLIDGAYDLCAPLLLESTLDKPAHCYNASCYQRDAKALHDISILLGRSLQAGDCLVLDADTVQQLRHAFAGRTVRAACQACEWYALCTEVACKENYAGVKLMVARPGNHH